MSKTKEVKDIIKTILSDGNIHNVKEIKQFICIQMNMTVTEGVIAGALKTMTTSGVIENIDRGKYRLNKNNQEESFSKQSDKNIYSQIISLTEKYRDDAVRIINSIEIAEENEDVIREGIRLRKKINIFLDELKKIN